MFFFCYHFSLSLTTEPVDPVDPESEEDMPNATILEFLTFCFSLCSFTIRAGGVNAWMFDVIDISARKRRNKCKCKCVGKDIFLNYFGKMRR